MTLTYKAKIQTWWEAAVNINFTAEYDPATNRTTVTFDESSLAYLGRANYYTSSYNTLTVQAVDNPTSSGTAQMNIGVDPKVTTNGGIKTFTGTPTPTQIVVQHSGAPGEKSVKITAGTTIYVYPTSESTSQATATGNGETTVKTGERRGVIRVDTGEEFISCMPYIDTGSAWEPLTPYIDDGVSWHSLA